MSDTRPVSVGDKILYNYHHVSKSKENKGRVERVSRYFGICVCNDRPDGAYTVIWWDSLGNQFSDRDAHLGNGHRQFERMNQ